MEPEHFIALLGEMSDEDIADKVLLTGGAEHVAESDIVYIARRIAEVFAAPREDVQVYVVGSAKLGFSIAEKRRKDSDPLPRFRPFRAESDIDLAVISRSVFDAIWGELSRHAYSFPYIPWRSGRLGEYLVHGWLRPDHFPRTRLRKCDDWWDLCRRLSREPTFGRRAVRGGLFYSYGDLVRYQQRSVASCRKGLELEE